jgi:N-acetylglucosaminyldiphosphoundecaprenol N-acetyl-beta-D-mannosaminyltransferase
VTAGPESQTTPTGTRAVVEHERLFGLDFVARSNERAMVDELLTRACRPRDDWAVVVTPNVDHVVRYASHPEERAVAEAADLVLPDGAPIVWVSSLAGVPLGSRVTGSGLFCELWPRLADDRVPVVAVVADHEVGRRLERENPATSVIVPPMFDVDDDAAVGRIVDEIVERTAATRTAFVVLGVSMPKHHRLARELCARRLPEGCEYPAVLLLGASAEFYTGMRRRAPVMLRRLGLEWLHRLATEPRRMARRYLIDDAKFVPIAAREVRHRKGSLAA